jgi:hypothetical protein
MEEWTVVEEKYESLARTDTQHADKIKQEMADQFEVMAMRKLRQRSSLLVMSIEKEMVEIGNGLH